MNQNVIRNHKDSLFQLAFRDNPEAALSLYNAINGSHHTDASKLKFELLGGGIFMSMENDNGFIMDQTLSMYEHQSTLNPNMPLRGLIYYGELYLKIVNRHRLLYSTTLIKIPIPQYIVFYNGTKDMGGEKVVLRLSDAFEKKDEKHEYEWTATMININYGHNEELMNSCRMLHDYAYFIQKVREYTCDMELRDAIMKAMNECIAADIFRDVLEKYREIIMNLSLLEFNEEEYKEYLIEEERQKTEMERKRADDEAKRADDAEKRADDAEKRVVHLEKEGAIKLILTLKNLDCNKETIQREFGRAYPELENCFEELYESVCTG